MSNGRIEKEILERGRIGQMQEKNHMEKDNLKKRVELKPARVTGRNKVEGENELN